MPMADKTERYDTGIAGTIEVEGEKIHYRFHSIGKGQCVIECSYYDYPISIEDNGFGLEYAIGLLRTEVLTQKRKRKNK
jgi:hypothetical protein